MDSPPTPAGNDGESGFTLVELMFVTFLFVLLATLSTSLFSGSIGFMRQDVASRDLMDLLNWTRERAIIERTDYAVHVLPQDHSYWLMRRDSATGSEFVRLAGKWGVPHHWPHGIEMKGEETSIFFHADGSSEPTELQFVQGEQTQTIIVEPFLVRGDNHAAS